MRYRALPHMTEGKGKYHIKYQKGGSWHTYLGNIKVEIQSFPWQGLRGTLPDSVALQLGEAAGLGCWLNQAGRPRYHQLQNVQGFLPVWGLERAHTHRDKGKHTHTHTRTHARTHTHTLFTRFHYTCL